MFLCLMCSDSEQMWFTLHKVVAISAVARRINTISAFFNLLLLIFGSSSIFPGPSESELLLAANDIADLF